MNYKRKNRVSRRSSKCSICMGQRRHLGPSIEDKKKMRILNKDLQVQLSVS